MKSIKRTFKEFFKINFLVDQAKGIISNRVNLTLNEMAIRGDVIKYPVKFDEDDIEFLSQFSPDYHYHAIFQRYELLNEALKDLFNKRKNAGYEDLKNAIYAAAISQNWDQLNDFDLPPDYLEGLKKQFSPRNIASWGRGAENKEREIDDSIRDNADIEAWEYISERLQHLDEENKPHDFVFCKNENPIDDEGIIGGRIGKPACEQKVVFPAKPFLNRLFHKLDRTQGQEHVQGSGLEGKFGEYGFDLFDPRDRYLDRNTGEPVDLSDKTKEEINTLIKQGRVKVDKVTPGFKIPLPDQVMRKMNEFKRFQAYQMFGKIPEKAPNGNPIIWVQSKLADTLAIETLLNKYEIQLYTELYNDDNARPPDKRRFQKNSDIEKEARRLAKEKVKDDVRDGKIKGPPSGKHPEGQLFTLDRQGNIVSPPLYLPYYKKLVARKVPSKNPTLPDEIVQREELVPFYLPTTYFRKLKKEDYEIDENGQYKKDENNKPILKPEVQRKITGYNKQFVTVDHHEYMKGRGDFSKGALDLTKQTSGQLYLRKGDPRYPENYEQIIDAMKRAKLKPGGGRGGAMGLEEAEPDADPNKYPIFYDIARGILNCLNTACVESTTRDRRSLISIFQSVHDHIYLEMLKTLRDEKLKTPEGRIAFAFVKTGILLQKDWGSGTRRNRLLYASGTKDVQTATSKHQKNRVNQQDDDSETPKKRSRGQKIAPTQKGDQLLPTSFDIRAIHNFQKEIEKDIKANKEKLQKLAGLLQSSKTIEQLEAEMKASVNLVNDIASYLAALAKENGIEKPEEYANRQVEEWQLKNLKPEEMFKIFRSDPLVAKHFGLPDDDTSYTPDVEVELSKDEDEDDVEVNAEIERLKKLLYANVNRILTKAPHQVDEYLKRDKKGPSKYVNSLKNEIGMDPEISVADQEQMQSYFTDEKRRKILNSLQDYVDELVRLHKAETSDDSEVETQPKPVVAPTKPQPTQVKQAARQLGQSQPTAQTKLPVKDFRQLYDEGDYIGLANHPEFLKYAGADDLQNLLQHFKDERHFYSPEEQKQIEMAEKNLAAEIQRKRK